MEYIEREKAVEIIKSYGKDAISKGKNTLDPVDDIILLANEVSMIPAADAVEAPHKIKTNYDRVKNMGVEKLAEFLNGAADQVCFELCERNTGNKYQCPYETQNCVQCIALWLESEVTE